ncbi:MAG: helix-turn-helix transcriptional regulator [Oscillibacter sp.]|nr:helix-turn-helix transcriptional regulator [Oscillibacter sp.]
MDTLQILGTRLKALRKERRLYQREVGELIGVTQRHYQKIEKGEINISVLTLRTLAGYFEVSADYLLGITDDPTRRGGAAKGT